MHIPEKIVCRFIGGFADGRVIHSGETSDGHSLTPTEVYLFTEGMIGRGVQGYSGAGRQVMRQNTYAGEHIEKGLQARHIYRVTESTTDSDGTLHLTLAYEVVQPK
jgi:hypothetical protein